MQVTNASYILLLGDLVWQVSGGREGGREGGSHSFVKKLSLLDWPSLLLHKWEDMLDFLKYYYYHYTYYYSYCCFYYYYYCCYYYYNHTIKSPHRVCTVEKNVLFLVLALV